MNGSYLLDTSIVIKIFAKDKEILKKVGQCSEVFIPTIVIGELYYGAYNSTKVKGNIKRIEQLTQTTSILDCNIETSREYGAIKKDLKSKGTPIPENDIWIAAIALQHDLPLAGRDQHFEYIDKLTYKRW